VRPLRRTAWSFRFAGQGLRYLLRSQPNFVIHCLAAALVVVLSVLLGLSPVEVGLLLLTIGSVLVCEAFNTALEAVVDLASPEHHELAKIAKDVAAAGVLIAAIVAALVGLTVLGPRLVARLWP
jgi:diacylglycerol kinase